MRKLVLAALCIALTFVWGTPAIFAGEAGYADAQKLLERQDFAAARDAFGALDGYEDSRSCMLYASARNTSALNDAEFFEWTIT